MPAGSITLADVADRTPTLAVACDRCDRAERYKLATLIALLSGDCPKRGSSNLYARCGINCPELPALFMPQRVLGIAARFRDISTAPREGTLIRLWLRDGSDFVGQYSDRYWGWVALHEINCPLNPIASCSCGGRSVEGSEPLKFGLGAAGTADREGRLGHNPRGKRGTARQGAHEEEWLAGRRDNSSAEACPPIDPWETAAAP
jgi:hypothetical protein